MQCDWAGVQLPQACSRVRPSAECLTLTSYALQALGIQRYIFFSIHNCTAHPEVPLMQFKACTEQYLKDSGLNYTIFRLCGFMQVRGIACGCDVAGGGSRCLLFGRSSCRPTVLYNM